MTRPPRSSATSGDLDPRGSATASSAPVPGDEVRRTITRLPWAEARSTVRREGSSWSGGTLDTRPVWAAAIDSAGPATVPVPRDHGRG